MGQLLPDAQGRLSRKQSVGSRSRSRLPLSPRTFWPQWVRRDPHPSESELLPRASLTHACPLHIGAAHLIRGPSPSPQENPLLELLGEETREAWCCRGGLGPARGPSGEHGPHPSCPVMGGKGRKVCDPGVRKQTRVAHVCVGGGEWGYRPPCVGTDWGGKEGHVGHGSAGRGGNVPPTSPGEHAAHGPRASGLCKRLTTPGVPLPLGLGQLHLRRRPLARAAPSPRGNGSSAWGEQGHSGVGWRGAPRALEGWCPSAREETGPGSHSAGHRQEEEAQQHQSHREDTREGSEPGLCPGPGSREGAWPARGGAVCESWRVAGEVAGACGWRRAQTEALGGPTRTTPSWK